MNCKTVGRKKLPSLRVTYVSFLKIPVAARHDMIIAGREKESLNLSFCILKAYTEKESESVCKTDKRAQGSYETRNITGQEI